MFVPPTFVALLIAVLLAPLKLRWPALVTLTAAVVIGVFDHVLTAAALPGVLLMAGLAWGAHRGLTIEVAAFAWAMVLSNYLAPGFLNPVIFDQVRFTPTAAPFTMYLNFDKTAAGLLLYVFVIPRPRARDRWIVWPAWLGVTAVMLGLTWAVDYARFEAKWPDGGLVWAMNNLFFVCLAEEAVFRGLLQRRLETWLGRAPAIGLAAVAFGIQHYRSGLPYVCLAAVAGLFYGYAYARTGRLESSMLVHFGLNLTHFALFTYPSVDHGAQW